MEDATDQFHEIVSKFLNAAIAAFDYGQWSAHVEPVVCHPKLGDDGATGDSSDPPQPSSPRVLTTLVFHDGGQRLKLQCLWALSTDEAPEEYNNVTPDFVTILATAGFGSFNKADRTIIDSDEESEDSEEEALYK